MSQERSIWGSKIGFLLAAIGSAVGLGNIWRFGYMAFEHGGGAFLVPYGVALLLAGIPLMILEYAKKIEADLIVIASHRPDLLDYFLGSTAARVVRHAECAVLVDR